MRHETSDAETGLALSPVIVTGCANTGTGLGSTDSRPQPLNFRLEDHPEISVEAERTGHVRHADRSGDSIKSRTLDAAWGSESSSTGGPTPKKRVGATDQGARQR